MRNTKKIAGGLLIGTAIGAATAWLFSTKSGQQLQKQMQRTLENLYEDMSEKTQDLVEQIARKSEEVSDHLLQRKPRTSSQINWIIVGLAGGAFGASALYILSADSAKEIRQNFVKSYQKLSDKTTELADNFQGKAQDVVDNVECHLHPWIKAAQKLIDNIGSEKKCTFITNLNKKKDSAADTVADLALMGIRLFKSIKK